METQISTYVEEIVSLDKRRCKVSLEGGFVFPLYKNEAKRFGIEQGEIIRQETWMEIMQKILPERAKARAYHLLQAKDYTETEMRRKLKEGCYPEEIIHTVILLLKEYHYIDDVRYAARYIESRKARQSEKKIRCDLWQKGIPEEILSPLFEENPCEEEEQIRKWLEKKQIDPEKSDKKERQKAMASLTRKGFSWDTIQRILR